MDKPDWWPKNPYPEDVFPMKQEDYSKIIPDKYKLAALSGMLGRLFWDIASDMIWDRLKEHLEDLEEEVKP